MQRGFEKNGVSIVYKRCVVEAVSVKSHSERKADTTNGDLRCRRAAGEDRPHSART